MSKLGLYGFDEGAAGDSLQVLVFSQSKFFVALMLFFFVAAQHIAIGSLLLLAFLWYVTKKRDVFVPSVRREKRPAMPIKESVYNYFHCAFTEEAVMNPSLFDYKPSEVSKGRLSLFKSLSKG